MTADDPSYRMLTLATLLWPGPDLSLAANVAIQQSILEQGGIAPLLALLNGVSDKAQV